MHAARNDGAETVSDTQPLSYLIRLGDSIHPDELTDEALACLTESLARYARKYLPEGYVLRLEASAYAHGVTLFQVTDVEADGEMLVMTQVNEAPDHWGGACDYAIQGGGDE